MVRVAFVALFSPYPCGFGGYMVGFVNDWEPLGGTSSMLEQALTHEAAKIGHPVGYAGGMFV